MLSLNDFDAELHDWIIVMHPAPFMACPTIVGTVRHDKTGRFTDGWTIRTSALLTPVEQIQPGAIVQTLNTRYLIAGAPARQN